MSIYVELLRCAADKMRTEIAAVPGGRWGVVDGVMGALGNVSIVHGAPEPESGQCPQVVLAYGFEQDRRPAVEYAAAWHPLVTAAVADLLDEVTVGIETTGPIDWDHAAGPMDSMGALRPEFARAVSIARAYLSENNQ